MSPPEDSVPLPLKTDAGDLQAEVPTVVDARDAANADATSAAPASPGNGTDTIAPSLDGSLVAALEAAGNGFALFDPEGRLLFINSAYRRFASGIVDVLVPGTTYDEILSVSLERGTIRQALGREEQWLAAERARVTASSRTEVFRVDSQRWLLREVGPLPDGGSLHIITDITEQKETLLALAESETRFRDLAEQATSWLWESDAFDRYTHVSGEFERVCGLRPESVLGMTRAEFYELYLEATDELASHFYRRRTGEAWKELSVTFRHPDGRPRYLLTSGGPVLDEAARLVGYRGTVRDITLLTEARAERGRLSAQLRHVQRHEAIGQVTSGIAHDFNNLLTAILGYVDLSLYRGNDPLTDRQRRHLHRVEEAATRGQKLIEKLITYHRGMAIEAAPGDPLPLLRRALDFVRATLPTSIVVEEDLTDKALRVALEGMHLDQVILNLAINARDALGGVGRMRIALHEVKVHGEVCASCGQGFSGRYACFSVSDSGPGITSGDVLRQMFDPFFTTKPPGKGSGLGLPVVHGIAHELDGHLVVTQSALGGLEVQVLFPVTGRD